MDVNSEIAKLIDEVNSLSTFRSTLLSKGTIRLDLLFPPKGIVTLENP